MNHSVEVKVYVLNQPDDIEYDEVLLEVVFDVDNYGYFDKITNYLLNGKIIDDLKDLIKENPELNRRIERAIEKYTTNYEEEFYDENR